MVTIEQEEQVVVFKLGKELYGLNIFQVKEIIRFTEVTNIPAVPDFIEGVINLRGKIIPILDLKKNFVLDQSEETHDTRIVIVEIKGQTLGLIVDGVEEVIRINQESIEMPSTLIGSMAQYVKGIGKVGDKLLILLALDELVTGEEISELQKIS